MGEGSGMYNVAVWLVDSTEGEHLQAWGICQAVFERGGIEVPYRYICAGEGASESGRGMICIFLDVLLHPGI